MKRRQTMSQPTVKRLKSWNFTTLGGWSEYRAMQRCSDADVTFTPVQHLGSTALAMLS
jgi:hypothetical protein